MQLNGMGHSAPLPVLAGLADVEGIGHTAPNASGALWQGEGPGSN